MPRNDRSVRPVDRRCSLTAVLAVALAAGVAPQALAQDNPLSPKSSQNAAPKNPLERDAPAANAPAPNAPAQAPNAAAPTQIVLKQTVMNDPGSGNMPSHTILAPAGWKVEGGAFWAPPALFNILPSQDIKVTAPDGRLVHVGPSLGLSDYRPSNTAMQQVGAKRPAERSTDNGRLVLYLPDDLNGWARFIEENAFRKSYPAATNFQMQPVVVVPELTTLLRRNLAPLQQQQEQMNKQFGGQMRGSIDGVVLAGTCFYELDGKKWEHLIIFGVTWSMTDNQVGRSIFWAIEPEVSYRAEAGQLEANMPLFMAIANSMHMTNQWAQMKADHIAKMNQIAAKGAADRSAIIANSNREISKIITDGYNERQASQDRSHYNFIKAIRGVEDYTAPGETPVQLPNNYSHIYSNGAGEYILTNNSLYDPNVDTNVNNHRWNPMQPAK